MLTSGRKVSRWMMAAAFAGLTCGVAPAAEIAMPAEGDKAAPPVNSGKISLSGGVDFTTHYFFRGIFQENQGFITQPYLNVGFKLYESDGPVNSVVLNIGTWNSFHTGPSGTTGATGDPRAWYEADLYGGVAIGLFNDFTATVVYTAYTSPNGVFETVQDITAGLAYNDAGLWEKMGLKGVALNPAIAFFFETNDEADAGNDVYGLDGDAEGIGFQAGITPSFVIIDSKDMPVTLSIPVLVGLSIDDYYQADLDGDGILEGNSEDDTFGYFSVGVVLSAPLSFIPADYGTWTAKAGVTFLFLGDTTEFLNNGDDFEAIGTFGLSMSY